MPERKRFFPVDVFPKCPLFVKMRWNTTGLVHLDHKYQPGLVRELQRGGGIADLWNLEKLIIDLFFQQRWRYKIKKDTTRIVWEVVFENKVKWRDWESEWKCEKKDSIWIITEVFLWKGENNTAGKSERKCSKDDLPWRVWECWQP